MPWELAGGQPVLLFRDGPAHVAAWIGFHDVFGFSIASDRPEIRARADLRRGAAVGVDDVSAAALAREARAVEARVVVGGEMSRPVKFADSYDVVEKSLGEVEGGAERVPAAEAENVIALHGGVAALFVVLIGCESRWR